MEGINATSGRKEKRVQRTSPLVSRFDGSSWTHYTPDDGLVDTFVEAVAITPEGTRGKTTYWRSGFYYMALGANVPVLLVSIDYQQRQIEIGPLIHPSGDIQNDFSSMRKFYAGKKGKYPFKQGEIRLRPDSE